MRKALVSAVLLAAVALAPRGAAASELTASYNVDIGPMTIMTVRFTVDLSADAAQARASIRNKGVSRVFSDYSLKAEADMRMGEKGPAPVSFHLKREKKDDVREATLRWGADGAMSLDPPIGNPERRARIEQAVSGGVTDPITAVLRMALAGESPCPGVHRAFDGRDVFELALVEKGRETLDGEAAYKGPVQRCEVRWTPIAGNAKEKNTPGDSYDVAFAPVGKLDSGRSLWLPVALSGTLKGVGFKAYAEKLNFDSVAQGAAPQ